MSLPVCELFGAGTCGKYLLREFVKRREVFYDVPGEFMGDDETLDLAQKHLKPLTADVDIPLLQFAGPELEQITKFRGSPNVGYVFSEWEPITGKQKKNLKAFDVLIAGSEWNARVIRDAGFGCVSVPQGVDTDVFKPSPRISLEDKFVIYSGGKYEHRKAQDLVIKAVKVLQERHDDILLLASWVNIFSSAKGGDPGLRMVELPLCGHEKLAHYMNQTDIGLFPNRCEGGTNLVMMDYLACGKPVVATVNTGQSDVLSVSYCEPVGGNDSEVVEQMINDVEMLYRDRGRLRRMGAAAREGMMKWPWSRTADSIEKAIAA